MFKGNNPSMTHVSVSRACGSSESFSWTANSCACRCCRHCSSRCCRAALLPSPTKPVWPGICGCRGGPCSSSCTKAGSSLLSTGTPARHKHKFTPQGSSQDMGERAVDGSSIIPVKQQHNCTRDCALCPETANHVANGSAWLGLPCGAWRNC